MPRLPAKRETTAIGAFLMDVRMSGKYGLAQAGYKRVARCFEVLPDIPGAKYIRLSKASLSADVQVTI